MTVDFNKPLVTRDGRKVKYLYTLNVDPAEMKYPVICVMTTEDGKEEMQLYTLEGYWFSEEDKDARDLQNVIPKKYKLVYHDGYVNSSFKASKDEFEVFDIEGRAGFLVWADGKISYEPLEA